MTDYGPKIDHGKPNQRCNVTVTSIRSSTLVQTKQNTCIYNRMRRFKIIHMLKSWKLLMRALSISISIRSSMCFSKQEVPCFLGFNNRHGVLTWRKSCFWWILHRGRLCSAVGIILKPRRSFRGSLSSKRNGEKNTEKFRARVAAQWDRACLGCVGP